MYVIISDVVLLNITKWLLIQQWDAVQQNSLSYQTSFTCITSCQLFVMFGTHTHRYCTHAYQYFKEAYYINFACKCRFASCFFFYPYLSAVHTCCCYDKAHFAVRHLFVATHHPMIVNLVWGSRSLTERKDLAVL